MKFRKSCFLSVVYIILFVSCTIRLNENQTRLMLDVILKDDLAVILEGIDTAALLDEPYYEYVRFNKYKEGQYQYLAEVDFYFLKEDLKTKIVRRYRFDKMYLKWERYYNKYESY